MNYEMITEFPIKDATNTILSVHHSLGGKLDENFKTAIKEIEAIISITDNILNFAYTNPDIFDREYKNWSISGSQYPQLRKAFNTFDTTVKNYTFNYETEFEEEIEGFIEKALEVARDAQILGEDITVFYIYREKLIKSMEVSQLFVDNEIKGVTNKDFINSIKFLLGVEEPTYNTELLNSIKLLTLVGNLMEENNLDSFASVYIYGTLMGTLKQSVESIEQKVAKTKANAQAYDFISASHTVDDSLNFNHGNKTKALGLLDDLEVTGNIELVSEIRELVSKL